MSEQLLTTPVTAQTGGNGHKPLPTNKKWVYLFGDCLLYTSRCV